ncbi:MAG: VOC family protein [Actinomycetota bacterium]|nr:VOC family protein [Actinomycetota bacterium]
MSRFGNQGLDHVAVAVSDIQRSRSFYEGVLGLERVYPAWEMPVVLAAAGTGVALFPESVHPSPTPNDVEPPAVRILHIAFRVDRAGFEAARGELAAAGVEARFSDHEISHSLYLRDPDGHQIELTTYEV